MNPSGSKPIVPLLPLDRLPPPIESNPPPNTASRDDSDVDTEADISLSTDIEPASVSEVIPATPMVDPAASNPNQNPPRYALEKQTNPSSVQNLAQNPARIPPQKTATRPTPIVEMHPTKTPPHRPVLTGTNIPATNIATNQSPNPVTNVAIASSGMNRPQKPSAHASHSYEEKRSDSVPHARQNQNMSSATPEKTWFSDQNHTQESHSTSNSAMAFNPQRTSSPSTKYPHQRQSHPSPSISAPKPSGPIDTYYRQQNPVQGEDFPVRHSPYNTQTLQHQPQYQQPPMPRHESPQQRYEAWAVKTPDQRPTHGRTSPYPEPVASDLSNQPSYTNSSQLYSNNSYYTPQSRSNSPNAPSRPKSTSVSQSFANTSSQNQELIEMRLRLKELEHYREKYRDIVDHVRFLESKIVSLNSTVESMEAEVRLKGDTIEQLNQRLRDSSKAIQKPTIILKETIHPAIRPTVNQNESSSMIPDSNGKVSAEVYGALFNKAQALEAALIQAQAGIPSKDQYVLELEKKTRSLDKELKDVIAQLATSNDENQRQQSLAIQKVYESREIAEATHKELQLKIKEVNALQVKLEEMKPYIYYSEESSRHIRKLEDQIRHYQSERKYWVKYQFKSDSATNQGDDISSHLSQLTLRLVECEAQLESKESRLLKQQETISRLEAQLEEKDAYSRQLSVQLQLLDSKTKMQAYSLELANKDEHIHLLEKRIRVIGEEMNLREKDWKHTFSDMKRKLEEAQQLMKLKDSKYQLLQQELDHRIQNHRKELETDQAQITVLVNELASRNTMLLQTQALVSKTKEGTEPSSVMIDLVERFEKVERERIGQSILIERLQNEIAATSVGTQPSSVLNGLASLDTEESTDDLSNFVGDITKELTARLRNKSVELSRMKARTAVLTKELLRYRTTTSQLEHQLAEAAQRSQA